MRGSLFSWIKNLCFCLCGVLWLFTLVFWCWKGAVVLVFSNLVFLCGGFLLFGVFCGCVFVSRAFVEKTEKLCSRNVF